MHKNAQIWTLKHCQPSFMMEFTRVNEKQSKANEFLWSTWMGRVYGGSEWAFDVIQGDPFEKSPNKGELWYGRLGIQHCSLTWWNTYFEFIGNKKSYLNIKWQVALVKLDPWCEFIWRQVDKRSGGWYSFKYRLVIGGTGSVLGGTDGCSIVLGR